MRYEPEQGPAFRGFSKPTNKTTPMQWLGHCYINGRGVPKDEHLGIMWIAKAAAQGHVIAQGLMKGLINHALASPPRSPT